MRNDKGSILILSMIVGTIMFILSTFLLCSIYLDHQIVNSSINNIQSYYLAEDKIYLCFNEGSSYYDDLILKLKHYLKNGRFRKKFNEHLIFIDKKDLNCEDTKNKIILDDFKENGIFKGCIIAESNYKSLNKKVIGKFTIVNPFYNTDTPILSKNMQCESEKDMEQFIDELFYDFKLEDFEDEIDIIEVDNFHKINIFLNLDKTKKARMDFFRYGNENPVNQKYLTTEQVFLISKDKKGKQCEINIYSNDEYTNGKINKNLLKGIIYVDGNLNLYGKVDFDGIIAINFGKLNVYSDIKPKITGMLILNDYKEDEGLIEEKVILEYKKVKADRYGVYIPGYVKPKLYLIKGGCT